MVVVINGQPTSGKSTFVEICRQIKGKKYIYEYSTVDFVKEIAKLSGWNGEKTPENRKFLSDLKELLTNWQDVPFKKTTERIEEFYALAWNLYRIPHQQVIAFIHCREPKEIQRFKDYYDEECVTVLIRRPTIENDNQSNHSDQDVFDYNYDYTIKNDGNLDDLAARAKQWLYFMQTGY